MCIAVPRPNPTRPEDDENDYVIERRIVFLNPDGSQSYGRIDLYKRGCFVLETKQGNGSDLYGLSEEEIQIVENATK